MSHALKGNIDLAVKPGGEQGKMKSISIPINTRFVGEGVKFERIRRITGC